MSLVINNSTQPPRENPPHNDSCSKDSVDTIACANCGDHGHTYRYCHKPVISYGIICFRYTSLGPEYLIVQRKDTFAFVEFIRGKYDISNIDYIKELFLTMTAVERSLIRDNDFEHCWKYLWNTTSKGRRVLEFDDSKAKFATLKIADGSDLPCVSANSSELRESADRPIDRILLACEGVAYEPEWGFPKGRRNINESDMKTAFREFSEETGIPTESLMLLSHTPFDETFRGSNGVRYKHVYYLARVDDVCKMTLCPSELRDCAWLDLDRTLSKFAASPERKRMLRRVHEIVVRRASTYGI